MMHMTAGGIGPAVLIWPDWEVQPPRRKGRDACGLASGDGGKATGLIRPA